MGERMVPSALEAAMAAIPGHPARMRAAAALGKRDVVLVDLLTAPPFTCTYGIVVLATQRDAAGLEALARRHDAFVVRARAARALAKVDQNALVGLFMTEGLAVQLKRVCLKHLTVGSDAIFESVLRMGAANGQVADALDLLRRLRRAPEHEDLVARWMVRLTSLHRAVEVAPKLGEGNDVRILAAHDMPCVYASTAARYPAAALKLLAATDGGAVDFRWYRAAQVLAKTHPDELLEILRAKMWQPRTVWFLARPLIRHRPEAVLAILRERRTLNGTFFQCFKKTYGNGPVRREMSAILKTCLAAGTAACEPDALERTVKFLAHRVNRGTRPCDVAAGTHALLTECLVAMARGGVSILESVVKRVEDDDEDGDGHGLMHDMAMQRPYGVLRGSRYRFPEDGYVRALTYALRQKKVVPLTWCERRVDLAGVFAAALAGADAVVRKHAAEMIADAVAEGLAPVLRGHSGVNRAAGIAAAAFDQQLAHTRTDAANMFRCLPLAGEHGALAVVRDRVAQDSFHDLPQQARCNLLAYLPVVHGGARLAGLANASDPHERVCALNALWRACVQQELLGTREAIPAGVPTKTAALLREINDVPTALAYIEGKLRRDRAEVWGPVIADGVLGSTPHAVLVRVPPTTLAALWGIVRGGDLREADPRAFEEPGASEESMSGLLHSSHSFADWAAGARVFAKMAAGCDGVDAAALEGYAALAETVFGALDALTAHAQQWAVNSAYWRWAAQLPEEARAHAQAHLNDHETDVSQPAPLLPMAERQLHAFQRLWRGCDAEYLVGCSRLGDDALPAAAGGSAWLRVVDTTLLAGRSAAARDAGDTAAAALVVAEVSKQRDYAAPVREADVGDMVHPLRHPTVADAKAGIGPGSLVSQLLDSHYDRGANGKYTEDTTSEKLLCALTHLLLSYRTGRVLYEAYGVAMLTRFPCMSKHAGQFFEATGQDYPWTPVGHALVLDLRGIRNRAQGSEAESSDDFATDDSAFTGPYKPCPTQWPAYTAIAEASVAALNRRDAYKVYDEHVGEFVVDDFSTLLPCTRMVYARVCWKLGLCSKSARQVCGFATPVYLQRLWRGVAAFQEGRLELLARDNAKGGLGVAKKKKILHDTTQSMLCVVDMVPEVRTGVVAAMEYMLACRVGDGVEWAGEKTTTPLEAVAGIFQMWDGVDLIPGGDGTGNPHARDPAVARVFEDVAALLVRLEHAHADPDVPSPVLARTGTGDAARCPCGTLLAALGILFQSLSVSRTWGALATPKKRPRFAHTTARRAALIARRARLRRQAVARMQQHAAEPRAFFDVLKRLLVPSMFADMVLPQLSWAKKNPQEALMPPLAVESLEWAFHFMMDIPGEAGVRVALDISARVLGGYMPAARARVVEYLRTAKPSDNTVEKCLTFLLGPRHMRAARARAICDGATAVTPPPRGTGVPRYPLAWAARYGTTWTPDAGFHEAFDGGIPAIIAVSDVVKRHVLQHRQDLLDGAEPRWFTSRSTGLSRFPAAGLFVTPMHTMLPVVHRRLQAASFALTDTSESPSELLVGTMLSAVPLSSAEHPVRQLLANAARILSTGKTEGAKDSLNPQHRERFAKSFASTTLSYLRAHPYPKEALNLLSEHICRGLRSGDAIGAFATSLACVDSAEAVAAAAALLARDDVGVSARVQVTRAIPWVAHGDAAVDLIVHESRIHDPTRTADKAVYGGLATTLSVSPLLRTHGAALWPIMHTLTATRDEVSTAAAQGLLLALCGQATQRSLQFTQWPTGAGDGVLAVVAAFVDGARDPQQKSLPALAQTALRRWVEYIAGCPDARVADVDAAALVAALERTPHCDLIVEVALALAARGHPHTMTAVMTSKLAALDAAVAACDVARASTAREALERLVRADRRVLACCPEGVIAAARVLLDRKGTAQLGLRLLAALVDWKLPQPAGEGVPPAAVYTAFAELSNEPGADKRALLDMLLAATSAAWDAENGATNHLERKVVGYLRQAYPADGEVGDEFVPVFTDTAKLNHLCLVHAVAQRAARYPEHAFPKALRPVLFALARESDVYAAAVMAWFPPTVAAKQLAKEEAEAVPSKSTGVHFAVRPPVRRVSAWPQLSFGTAEVDCWNPKVVVPPIHDTAGDCGDDW